MDLQLARAQMLEMGLSPARVQPLLDLTLPCLRLELDESLAGEALPPCTSKLYGDPDVPPDWQWPTHFGVPLEFMGQYRPAEARRFLPEARVLPDRGLLSFFLEQGNINERDPDQGTPGWRVFWWPDVNVLAPRTHPSFEAMRMMHPPSLPIHFHPAMSYCSATEAKNHLGMTQAEVALYWDFLSKHAYHWEYGSRHQILGHPVNDYNDPHPWLNELDEEGGVPTLHEQIAGFERPRKVDLLHIDMDSYVPHDPVSHGAFSFIITQSALEERRLDEVMPWYFHL